MPTDKIGQKIYRLRRQNGYSQEEFADLIGVSRQSVSKWELDETLPNADSLMRLSQTFDVPIEYFLPQKKSIDQNSVFNIDVANNDVSNLEQDSQDNNVTPVVDFEQQNELAIAVLTQIRQSEIAATKEKKSKRCLICLSIIAAIIAIIAVPVGLIAFSLNKGNLETLHTFDFVNPLSWIFLGLVIIFAVIITMIIIVAIKRHKK